jgi:hypothetical protein
MTYLPMNTEAMRKGSLKSDLGSDQIVDAWFGAGSILFRFLDFAFS